jgi:DNA-binding NarL/FixJ family response regulator
VEMQATIKVLVAGCPTLLQTLRAAVRRARFIQLAGETESSGRLLQAVAAAPFDLLVVDVDLPGLGGVAGLRAVHVAQPKMKILLAGGYFHDRALANALRHGVLGCVVKPGHPDDYLAAMYAIWHGDVWFPRSTLAQAVMNLAERRRDGTLEQVFPVEWQALTARERDRDQRKNGEGASESYLHQAQGQSTRSGRVSSAPAHRCGGVP